jgi:thioredoxin-related protein
MQRLKLLVLFVGIVTVASAYKPKLPAKTRWYSLQDASAELKKEKRPVLIDLYTDWCGWCKVMDKKTYSDKNVVEYLAEKFYPVKVDAESHETIVWKDKTFKFNPAYRTNEFAMFLSNGQLSYPTTVIIPPDSDEPQAIPGYMTPKEFELILKYFGEGIYKKMPFDKYEKQFKGSW